MAKVDFECEKSQVDIYYIGKNKHRHTFSIYIDDFYGKEFFCNRVVPKYKECPSEIHLIHNLDMVRCPYCQSNEKKIQKSNERKVLDLFNLEDSDGEIGELDTFDQSLVVLKVFYQNNTYRCKNPSCHSLYRVKCSFLSDKEKSPFSKRAISFIRDRVEEGVSVYIICEKMKAYGARDISRATVYSILEEEQGKDHGQLLSDYDLDENKNILLMISDGF